MCVADEVEPIGDCAHGGGRVLSGMDAIPVQRICRLCMHEVRFLRLEHQRYPRQALELPSTDMVLRPGDRLPSVTTKIGDILETGHSRISIAEQRCLSEGAGYLDASAWVGTVADHIIQANPAIDPATQSSRYHGLEGVKVGVKIGEDQGVHSPSSGWPERSPVLMTASRTPLTKA